MSVVYGATRARLGMPAALQVLISDLGDDDAFLGRFPREAHAAAGIDHPIVSPVHDVGVPEESLSIAMRRGRGSTSCTQSSDA
jgi:eukaryotic-like serine/threonine-protein kinase